MTTRPLRHADDTAQELINLRHRRDLLHQELEWLEAVIADMERRGGDPPARSQRDTRHQVGIGQPPEGRAPNGGE